MRFSLVFATMASCALAASSWTFSDGTLSISSRSDPEGAKKLSISPDLLASLVTLTAKETLKVLLTTKEGTHAKRPHQAFLLLTDPSTKLESFFVLTLKDSGKARVEVTHKDIPPALLTANSTLDISLILASTGSSTPTLQKIGAVRPIVEESAIKSLPSPSLRYKSLAEIKHIFRSEPKNPPIVITLVFLGGVLACLPALFVAWLALGANVNSLSSALSTAPISHLTFFGSLVALEVLFGLYYTSWTLFQTLAVAAIIAPVSFLSGSRALREVRGRRLEGKR